MSYRFIVNPITNRKVSVNGRLGKQIVNQYLKQGGGANSQTPLAFLRARQNKKTTGNGSPRRQTARASNCTLHHNNPIKCNTTESCTYRTISGKGQCYKSRAANIEQARERARTGATVAMKKGGQEKAFDRAVGSMLMKGLKRRKSFGAVVDVAQQAEEVKAQTCKTDIATLRKEKIQLLEEHATQIASLEQRIEEIRGEKDEQIATLEQRIEEMQGEKDALIAAHTAEIARLQQETGSSFDQERESLQQANQQCQTQKEELTAARDAAASEYETEKERLIAEHQAAIEELRQEIEGGFTEERESLQQATQQCQTQKEELIRAHEEAIAQLRQETGSSFDQERESLQQANQQCQTQKEAVETERDALKVERDQYKESISALEEQIAGLAQQITQLEQTMGDCEPRIEGLTSELTEAREAESTCKARIESILEEKDELVTAHRSEITRVSEENTLSQKDLKAQIRTLDNELKLLNRGLERTLLQEQRKLERAQAQITELNRRKTALETQLAESEQQYIATTEILERERLEKARLVKELQDVKKRLGGGGGNQPCRNPRSAACRAHRRSAAMFEPIDYARVSRSAGKKKCESYKHNETQCNADPGCNYINYNCISKIKASKALHKRARRTRRR